VCTQQGALQGENGVRAHSSQACPSAAGGWPGLAGSALEATHGQSSHGPIMMWPRKQKRLLPGHSLYSILRGCIIPAAPSTSSSSPLFADVGESNAASSPTLPPLAGKRGIATLSHQSPPTTSRGSHQAGASSQPGVISSASMRATQRKGRRGEQRRRRREASSSTTYVTLISLAPCRDLQGTYCPR
jgi:hypothetical protein